MTPFCYNCFISISLKDWWRWKHFAWCMQVQQSDSGLFHCNWISCIALGSGRDLLCSSSSQKTVYPLSTALKYVIFLWTRWGLMLSFTEAVRHNSQKRRKARPYCACSASPSRSPPFLCATRTHAGEGEPVHSMFPSSWINGSLSSFCVEGVALVLAAQKWQHCSYQHCCAGGREGNFLLV